MKHPGVIVALLVALALIPVGVTLADVVSRSSYSLGYGIAPTKAGPGEPDSVGARIFRAGVRGALTEVPRSVSRVEPGTLNMVGCARCHGAFGRGGPVPVVQGSAFAPPVTYTDLILSGYTDAGIGSAVRTGVDASGRKLNELMPRWDLDDGEMRDLLAHLKALSVR